MHIDHLKAEPDSFNRESISLIDDQRVSVDIAIDPNVTSLIEPEESLCDYYRRYLKEELYF